MKESADSESLTPGCMVPGFRPFLFTKEIEPVKISVNIESKRVRIVISRSVMSAVRFCGEDFIMLCGSSDLMSKKLLLQSHVNGPNSRKLIKIGDVGGAVKYPLIEEFRKIYVPPGAVSCLPKIEKMEQGRLFLDLTGVTWKKLEPKLPKQATT